ncbi:ABC transporter family substrate-binding protein [Mycobacterium spongiae]|uniref:Probable monoacyl phosphatidylinositol tetramannoside-binding protein LpqW n=1 Tax=Mycobacterium spongiae TaxID=886343 RepID=A0A975PZQ9_9MYCO|nr:ABC transporter family substrate-binding protein [Mycobacterium spongiae]QUR69898.1 ABC transporter family substrate-binding protein [Mycobacterium spongiae]
MGMSRRARRLLVGFGVLVSLVGLVSGCTVSPPPAPQSTDTPHNSPPPPQRPIQIIMGIDSIGPGFNPHLLSDLSPVNAAISALVLPSAFRPVPDPNTPTGSRWEMDPTLLVSARVTRENPFTVAYKIRPEAQWTDNAPIAADDFWYLWQQMVTQPGVVDPAGYDLITGVQSLDGGKQAVVTFAQPYPAWRELFSNILPAHIVKDIPGGFAAGLARAMPVTGGQFRVDNIDPQRDEILIARNDRYWGRPAKPALILFRRAGSPAALADSMRNRDTQVAQVHGGSAAFAQLSAIPDVQTARIVTPRVMQLTLRANVAKLAERQVRKAILGLLDVDLLAAVGAGTDNTVTLDQAQIRSPSDPGYVPTAPPAMGTTVALGLLEESGFQVESNASVSSAPPSPDSTAAPVSTGPPKVIRGRISKNGKQLALVIGVASNDPTSVAVANTAADQLRNVGIAATVLALDPVVLYRDALRENRVDAIVGWRQAGGNLATLLASRYGCPALQATEVLTPTGTPTALPDTTLTTPAQPPAAPPAPPKPGALVKAPSNLTGTCDLSIQSNIDAALDGTKDIDEVITAVEPRLWNMSTVLPILQDTTIVAAGPSVQNVSLSGAVPVGIVGDAGRWIKTGS